MKIIWPDIATDALWERYHYYKEVAPKEVARHKAFCVTAQSLLLIKA